MTADPHRRWRTRGGRACLATIPTGLVVGWDFIGDFSGKPALSASMSLRRAKLLFECLGELGEAYTRALGEPGDEWPFARALCVIEISEVPVEEGDRTTGIPIDNYFRSPPLALAPIEYRQFAQLVTVLATTETLEGSAPLGRPKRAPSRVDSSRRCIAPIGSPGWRSAGGAARA